MAVLLGTGRINLGVVMLSKGGTSSWQLGNALSEKLCLAFPIICLREFLMRWDTCLDPDAGQKLTTIDPPPLPLSPSSKEKEWSELIWL